MRFEPTCSTVFFSLAWEVVALSAVSFFIDVVVLAVIGGLLAKWALEIMGTPDDVIGQSALYMRIYFMGMPFFMLYNYGGLQQCI